MSAQCPQPEPKTPAEDRRRRSERRAAAGEVLVKATRRPPENLAADAVAPIDRRTKIGRALTAFRTSLAQHVGGSPSGTQRAIIEQAAQLRARLLVMDARFTASGEMSAHDSRTYLAWANSLARIL